MNYTHARSIFLIVFVIFIARLEPYAQSIAFGGSLGLLESFGNEAIDKRYLGPKPTQAMSLRVQLEPAKMVLKRKISFVTELMRLERQFALRDVRPRGGPAPFPEAIYATNDLDLKISLLLDLTKELKFQSIKGTFRPKAGIIAVVPIAREEIQFDFVAAQGFPNKIEYFQARLIDSEFAISPGLAFDFSYENVLKNSNYSIIIGVNASYNPFKNQRYEITFNHEDNYSSRTANHSRSGANLYILLGINRS